MKIGDLVFTSNLECKEVGIVIGEDISLDLNNSANWCLERSWVLSEGLIFSIPTFQMVLIDADR